MNSGEDANYQLVGLFRLITGESAESCVEEIWEPLLQCHSLLDWNFQGKFWLVSKKVGPC